MKYINVSLVMTVLLLLIVSCDKNEVGEKVPGCIRDKIELFGNGTVCESEASVIRYDFQGSHVYAFDPGGCIADSFVDIYDSECNLICQLRGLAGIATCEGLNFDQNATNPVVVWEN